MKPSFRVSRETEKRSERSFEEWDLAERMCVLNEVNHQRALLACAPVVLELIGKAEILALGHFDCLSQYAHAAARAVFTP